MTKKRGPCEYCMSEAPVFMEPPESEVDVFLCMKCSKLIRNPLTALPLIRGNLTLKLRGEIPENNLKDMINKYMEQISNLRPKT